MDPIPELPIAEELEISSDEEADQNKLAISSDEEEKMQEQIIEEEPLREPMRKASDPKTTCRSEQDELIEPEQLKQPKQPDCKACRKYVSGYKCASCTWKEFGYDVVDIEEKTSSIYSINKVYAAAAAAAKRQADGKSFLD